MSARAYGPEVVERLLAHADTVTVGGAPVLVRSSVEGLPAGRLDPWLARHEEQRPPAAGGGLQLTPEMLKDPAALLLMLRDKVEGLAFSADAETSADLAEHPVEVRRLDLTLVDHPTPVWVYERAGSTRRDRPALVHVHSGGFFMGRPNGRDNFLRFLADRADAVVLDVDYSLSPEITYPAAVHETVAAVRYARDHAAELGIDPARIALGGGSAGGNLTAAGSLLARDQGLADIALQVLINAAVLQGSTRPDWYEWPAEEFPSGPPGPFSDPQADPGLALMFGAYAPDSDPGADPYLSPLVADDLTGLPPALVITAELDNLRPEAELYAARLAAAGVQVRTLRYRGTKHDTQGLLGHVPTVEAAAIEVADALVSLPGRPFDPSRTY